jgi:hypothetical protein
MTEVAVRQAQPNAVDLRSRPTDTSLDAARYAHNPAYRWSYDGNGIFFTLNKRLERNYGTTFKGKPTWTGPISIWSYSHGSGSGAYRRSTQTQTRSSDATFRRTACTRSTRTASADH